MHIKESPRFYELDLLRFIAALIVVLFHYTFRYAIRENAFDKIHIFYFPHLGGIFKYGMLGVDLFFLISGFVVILTACNRNATSFVVSRMVRLYPMFWVCVTLTAIMTVLLGGKRYDIFLSQYLFNLTMLSGYFGIKAVDGIYWTLLVELQFYFLIFIIIATNQIRRIGFFLGLWAFATLFISFFGAPGVVKFVLFPEWSCYFIAGAMFYLVRLEGVGVYKIFVIALSYCLSMMRTTGRIAALESLYGVLFSKYIIMSLITLFFIIFFFISLGKTKLFNQKAFLSYGALTYPLYLIHNYIGAMIFDCFEKAINRYVLLIMTVCLMLYVAYLINKFVEQKLTKPFRNLLVSCACVLERRRNYI